MRIPSGSKRTGGAWVGGIVAGALLLPGIGAGGGCQARPPPVADVAPPRSPRERPSRKPGPDYFWVDGHYEWLKTKKIYHWRPGRWEKFRKGYRLAPAHYKALNDGRWQYYPERWEKVPTSERYERR